MSRLAHSTNLPGKSQPQRGRGRMVVIVKLRRFSAIVNSRTSPRRCRSSGMCPTPASSIARALAWCIAPRAADRDLAAFGPAQARDRLDELPLSISVDPCDPDDLSRHARSKDTPRRPAGPVVHDVAGLHLEHGRPPPAAALLDPEQHVLPTIIRRQLPPPSRPPGNGVDLLAPTQDPRSGRRRRAPRSACAR